MSLAEALARLYKIPLEQGAGSVENIKPKEQKLSVSDLNVYMRALQAAIVESKLTPKYKADLLADLTYDTLPLKPEEKKGATPLDEKRHIFCYERRLPETLQELTKKVQRSVRAVRDYDPSVSEQVEKLELKKIFDAAMEATHKSMGQSPAR